MRADVVLAPLFTDHAVLQQGKPIPVWGTAVAGEPVTVVFRGDSASTRADAAGLWRVTLPGRAATAEPAELTVNGRNRITLRDIVVGEVWLASGQSNMEFKVRDADGGEEAIASSRFPLIRHIRLAHQVAAEPIGTSTGEWQPASPSTVPDFTAAGYFFARELWGKLNVPIGIIHNSWGGTPIEAWMPAKVLASDGAFAVVQERWTQTLADYPGNRAKFDAEVAAWSAEADAAKAKGEKLTKPKPVRVPPGPGHRHTPSGLYNGMIHPLAPYALRGVLWYQGEDNASRAGEYHRLFAAMITGWREAFGQGDLPFYWVQLANYESPRGPANAWAFLREAQDRTLSLPSTGQALAIDLGNPANIHPSNKREVGRRLALIALAKTYGQPVAFSGPRFQAAVVEGAAVRITLSDAEGLCIRGESSQSFELAGADQKFVPAEVRIEGERLAVSASGLANPVAVRYAWRNNPAANVYNGAGLPLAPFRSDSW